MKYYNRDNYERNLESYEVPEYFTKGARNDFVYSFIVGAVIGSAVGLVSLSKGKNKDKSVPDKDNQFKAHIIKQSKKEQQEAEQQVNTIKSTISEAQEKDTEVSEAELAAQKIAIQQETSDNNLANMSPVAQEQQEVLLTESQDKADDIPTHIDSNAEPSKSEVRAQQHAIQQETNTDENSDSDNSNLKAATTATGGTIAATSLAKAASKKKDALDNDSQVSENTSNLLKEAKPSTNKKGNTPNLVTKSDDKQSDQSEQNHATKASVLTATGLALAAQNKNKALNDDVTVAEKTALLLKPETPLQANNKSVPSLVTPKVDNAVESTTDKVEPSKNKNDEKNAQPGSAEQRVKQTHQSASFNEGIIVHDEASGLANKHNGKSTSKSTSKHQSDGILNHDAVDTLKSEQQDESDQNNITENRPQTKKTEKAKSKIDKRTFND